MPHAIFFEPPITSNFLGHQFAEIYKDRVYSQFIEGKNLKTCLEVGANIGVVSYYFSQHFKEVYSLEPSLEHFEVLTKMIEYNKLDNVHPINKALFIKSGKYPLFHPLDAEGVENNKTMYSLHQGVANPQNAKSEEVDCVTLPQLFADHGIEHVDFMKTDIEGSETELFSSDSFREVADKIDTIVVETHAWSGRHPNQILEAFKSNNFTVEQIPNDATLLVARRNVL